MHIGVNVANFGSGYPAGRAARLAEDPDGTNRPEVAWRMPATVAARWDRAHPAPTTDERSDSDGRG